MKFLLLLWLTLFKLNCNDVGRIFWRSFAPCTRCQVWFWSGGVSLTLWLKWCFPCRGRRSTTPHWSWTEYTPLPRHTQPQVKHICTQIHKHIKCLSLMCFIWAQFDITQFMLTYSIYSMQWPSSFCCQVEWASPSPTYRMSPKTLRFTCPQWWVRAHLLKIAATWPPNQGRSRPLQVKVHCTWSMRTWLSNMEFKTSNGVPVGLLVCFQ